MEFENELTNYSLTELRAVRDAYRAQERLAKDNETKKMYRQQRREIDDAIKDRFGRDVEYTPIGDNVKIFNPCLDFVDGVCYVTVQRTFITKKQINRGRKGVEIRNQIENLPFIITSEKEGFVLSEVEAESRELYYKNVPLLLSKRWSDKGIEDYLSGRSKGVDPKDLFERTRERFEFYMDWPNPLYYDLFALYATSTYFYPLFAHQPIIFLNGETASGKSKTLDILEQLAFNSLKSAHISDASLYRLVEANRPTLLLDESERLSNEEDSSGLINLLLAGSGPGAKVYRSERDGAGNFAPRSFETQCPKVVANIKGLKTEALINRCISFNFIPYKDKEKASSDPGPDDGKMETIRHDFYLLLLNHWQDIKNIPQELPQVAGLSGRSWKMWLPILTMAYFFESFGVVGLFEKVAQYATKASKELVLTSFDSFLGKLLGSLDQLTRGKEASQFYSTAEITQRVASFYNVQQDWLTDRYVSGRTAKAGFGSATRGTKDSKQCRGFFISRGQVEDICGRFKFGLEDIKVDTSDASDTKDTSDQKLC